MEQLLVLPVMRNSSVHVTQADSDITKDDAVVPGTTADHPPKAQLNTYFPDRDD